MSGARGVVAVQEAQWVANLRRTLKDAVAETLQERPRPEQPSLRVVEHLQQMLCTPEGTAKEAASGLESEVRRLVEENQRLTLALARTEEQLKAGSAAAEKSRLKLKAIGEAPKVVQGMDKGEHRMPRMPRTLSVTPRRSSSTSWPWRKPHRGLEARSHPNPKRRPNSKPEAKLGIA